MIGDRGAGLGRPASRTDAQIVEPSFASKLAALQNGWQGKSGNKPKESTKPKTQSGYPKVPTVTIEAGHRPNHGFLGNKDFEYARGSINTNDPIPEENYESSPTFHEGQETSEVMINKYEPDPNYMDLDNSPGIDNIGTLPGKRQKIGHKKKLLKKSNKASGGTHLGNESSNDNGLGNDLIGIL